MAAYRDGTFEKKTKAGAERQQTEQRKAEGGVQKGRDLYESMYPTKKKDQ
jgi:hypothetical protein